jgi:uncharacterized protein with GYD domain
MVQGNYTAESWAGQVSNPVDRIEIARKAIAGFGGKLIVDYYAFGDYDFVLIMEMPNNEAAAGFVIAIASTGMSKNFKTTHLMTGEEGVSALKQAATLTYQTPND